MTFEGDELARLLRTGLRRSTLACHRGDLHPSEHPKRTAKACGPLTCWTRPGRVYGINYLVDGNVYPKSDLCPRKPLWVRVSAAALGHKDGRKPPPFKLYFKDNTW